MKKFAAISLAAFTAFAATGASAFWDSKNKWEEPECWYNPHDCNPYDEWDPRYWMEEMSQMWDDDDYGYGGMPYGMPGGYGPYGPRPMMPYGGAPYGGAPYGAPMMPQGAPQGAPQAAPMPRPVPMMPYGAPRMPYGMPYPQQRPAAPAPAPVPAPAPAQ